MSVSCQVAKLTSGDCGLPIWRCMAERAFCTTLSLRKQGCSRKCRPEKNQSPAPTLPFHL